MESIGIDEAMRNRHSVRKYQDKPLEEHAVRELQKVIDTCNAAVDLFGLRDVQ